MAESEAELAEDTILQECVKQAKQKRAITEAKTILEKAKEVRQDIGNDSPRYQEITEIFLLFHFVENSPLGK